MKLAQARQHAMSLPEVTEQPHFTYSSFRVRGKIFVTVPPEGTHLHLFVNEAQRELALAMDRDCVEPLTWGAKVVGLRLELAAAKPAVVKQLIAQAWTAKAPRALLVNATSSLQRQVSISARK